jgi:hypothetical protein
VTSKINETQRDVWFQWIRVQEKVGTHFEDLAVHIPQLPLCIREQCASSCETMEKWYKFVSDIENSRNSEGRVISMNTCARKSLNSFWGSRDAHTQRVQCGTTVTPVHPGAICIVVRDYGKHDKNSLVTSKIQETQMDAWFRRIHVHEKVWTHFEDLAMHTLTESNVVPQLPLCIRERCASSCKTMENMIKIC